MSYKEFIDNILNTRGRFSCGNEYHERHHIVPKCMGGSNDKDNLIDLFAREHFEAHRLLALENPDNYKLASAFSMMAFPKNKNQNRCLTAKEFEEARILFGNLHKGRNHPMFGKYGENNPNYGRKKSSETRRKISENHANFSGENHPLYGKHHSNETKEKISNKLKKRWAGGNHPWYGRHHTEQTKEKISKANKGKLTGNKNHNYGKPLSNETRKKISKSLEGRFKGSKSSRAKLTVQCDKNNNVIDIWSCVADIKRVLNINDRNVSACCRGEKKTAKNFIWKYLYDQPKKDGTIILGAISLGFITEEEALDILEKKLKGEC